MIPIITDTIVDHNTAPAEISFISRILSLMSGSIKSASLSIAVLMISVDITIENNNNSIIHFVLLIANINPVIETIEATDM